MKTAVETNLETPFISNISHDNKKVQYNTDTTECADVKLQAEEPSRAMCINSEQGFPGRTHRAYIPTIHISHTTDLVLFMLYAIKCQSAVVVTTISLVCENETQAKIVM
jgi:hypothetical protein